MVWIVRLVGALLLVLTLLPLLKTGAWFVRVWDFPRLQLFVMLLVLGLASAMSVAVWSGPSELRVWSVLLLMGAVWQGSHVVKFTPLWPKDSPKLATRRSAHQLAVANLKFDNETPDAATTKLRELDADILVLLEIDHEWSERLATLHDEYPHRHDEIRGEGLGIAVWSRLPLENPQTRYVVEEHRPSIWATVRAEEATFELVAVHPTPPGLDDSTGEARRDSRVRDAELVMVAREVAENPERPCIVAGDFNDVAWSHTTRLFKRLSGLRDPRIGRSFTGTYHADYPALRFPIDHAFISEQFGIASLARHRIPGSDHFAMSVTMGFVFEQNDSPEPEEQDADQEEAEKLIEEGREDAEERGVSVDG